MQLVTSPLPSGPPPSYLPPPPPPPCCPITLPSAPVTEPELAHREAEGPATGIAVGGEDLLLVLLGLDVLLPLLLAVAVLTAEPAVVAHLGAQSWEHRFVGATFRSSAPHSAPPGWPSHLALAQHVGSRAYHDVSIVRGHLDLLLPFPRAEGRPFSWLARVVFL